MIELNIASPKNEALMSTVKYTRLGHFTLSDNTKNNYKSRELKSVFLDHNCKYLKISLNKPFYNKHNPFNQVGIASIVWHGYRIEEYEGEFFKFNYSEDMQIGGYLHNQMNFVPPVQQVQQVPPNLM